MESMPNVKAEQRSGLCRLMRDIQEHRTSAPRLITLQETSAPVRRSEGHVLKVKAPFPRMAPVTYPSRIGLGSPRFLLHVRKAAFEVACLCKPHPISNYVQAGRPEAGSMLALHALLNHGIAVCCRERTQVFQGLLVMQHLGKASIQKLMHVRGSTVV